MTRFLILVLLGGGCILHTGSADDQCSDLEPAPVQLVDPVTLFCQSFSTGPRCPCGVACPAIAAVPIPSWGACDSACSALDETACAASTDCRVALDWAKHFTTGNDFLGCFPLDTNRTTLSCGSLDAQACSTSAGCSALYEVANGDTRFKECIPEGQQPGSCTEAASCDRAAPTCPTNTMPGVANGCYTGACIPDQFCPVF